MRLLDLFCGAGGCSVGYYRAGFEVVGVDIKPMRNYPFEFHKGDALDYLAAHGREFDAIHASPPCQKYSSTRHLPNVKTETHVDLIEVTRSALEAIGRPWVMENVMGAPMKPPAIMLCGLMFNLKVFRHRWFESSHLLFGKPHEKHGDRRVGKDGFVCVAGNGGGKFSGWGGRRQWVPPDHRNKAAWSAGMGINWMTRDELAQSIPPAYTEFIGKQLADMLRKQ